MDRLRNVSGTTVDYIESLLFYILLLSDSAIYIPQLRHGGEWLLILLFFFFAKDEWEWQLGIKNKKGGGGWGGAKLRTAREGSYRNVKVTLKWRRGNPSGRVLAEGALDVDAFYTKCWVRFWRLCGASILVRSVNKIAPYFAVGSVFFYSRFWQTGIQFKTRWAVWCCCHVFSARLSPLNFVRLRLQTVEPGCSRVCSKPSSYSFREDKMPHSQSAMFRAAQWSILFIKPVLSASSTGFGVSQHFPDFSFFFSKHGRPCNCFARRQKRNRDICWDGARFKVHTWPWKQPLAERAGHQVL